MIIFVRYSTAIGNGNFTFCYRPDESTDKPVDRRIKSLSDLKKGEFVRGYVVYVSKDGIKVR